MAFLDQAFIPVQQDKKTAPTAKKKARKVGLHSAVIMMAASAKKAEARSVDPER